MAFLRATSTSNNSNIKISTVYASTLVTTLQVYTLCHKLLHSRVVYYSRYADDDDDTTICTWIESEALDHEKTIGDLRNCPQIAALLIEITHFVVVYLFLKCLLTAQIYIAPFCAVYDEGGAVVVGGGDRFYLCSNHRTASNTTDPSGADTIINDAKRTPIRTRGQ